jgi:hypothetical protein
MLRRGSDDSWHCLNELVHVVASADFTQAEAGPRKNELKPGPQGSSGRYVQS